jgi:WD40 repeat protein
LENYSNAYLLDVLMINIDRTRQNLNLLASSNGEIIISDFDSSLIFYELLKGSLIAKDNRILQALKTNPFYQPIDKVTLQEFIEKVNRLNFDEIFDEIPSILLDKQSKQDLLSKINKKMIRGWDLLDTLKSIDNTIIESESERDLRIRNNREKLEHLVRLTNNRSR